jgi:hypothetical protein
MCSDDVSPVFLVIFQNVEGGVIKKEKKIPQEDRK